jgi:GntR family transcriptional regulator
VNFSDHAHVYLQISHLLRQKIGVDWRVGEALPSEEVLAEAYNVTRVTLRRAVSILVDDGLLKRRRGQPPIVARSSIAAEGKLEADPSALFQLRAGTRFELLKFERVQLPGEAIRHLELEPASNGYSVDRMLDEQGEYLAYVQAYVVDEVGCLLDVKKMNSMTLTAQMTRYCGLHIESAEQYVEAELADVFVGPALSIPLGSAILKCRYVLRDEQRKPLLVATYHYRADRYRLALEIETKRSGEAHNGARVDGWPMRTIVKRK